MSVKQIATGTALVSSVNIIRILIQALSIPLLAHLLSPEDYGLSAMAMPIIYFGMMIANSGLGTSLIRDDNSAPTDWDSCFWLSLLLGFVLSALVALLSPVIGILAQDPRLPSLLASLTIAIAIQTASIVPNASLQKHHQFGTTTIIEFVSLLVGVATVIGCATNNLGAWSFVWQQISSCLARTSLSIMLSPYKPSLTFKLSTLDPHLHFGWHILSANMVSFAGRSVENILIGRLSGPPALGLYSMAAQLAKIPFLLISGPLQQVIYPYITSMGHDEDKIRTLFLLTTRTAASLIFPAVGLATFACQDLVLSLLPERWEHTAGIFQLIAPAAALQALAGIANPFLMGLGRTDLQAKLATHAALISLCGVAIGVWYGLVAIAAISGLSSVALSVRSLSTYLPLLGCTPSAYIGALYKPTIACAVSIGTYATITMVAPMDAVSSTVTIILISLTAFCVSLATQRTSILNGLSAMRGPHD